MTDVLPPEPPEERTPTAWEREHLLDPPDDAEREAEPPSVEQYDAREEHDGRIRAELVADYWRRQYDLQALELNRCYRLLRGERDVEAW